MTRARYITLLMSVLLALEEELAVVEAAGSGVQIKRVINHAKQYGKRHKITEEEILQILDNTPRSQLQL